MRQKFFPRGAPKSMHGSIADYVKREKEEKGQKFLVVCPVCGAVRQKKRWYWDGEVKESKRVEHDEKICDGCEAIKNKWIEGEVVLKNNIINLVPEQMQNLLENIELEARKDNVRNRIVQIKKLKNFWKVYTSSTFLAQLIGKELESAYNSKLTTRYAEGDKYVVVTWE